MDPQDAGPFVGGAFLGLHLIASFLLDSSSSHTVHHPATQSGWGCKLSSRMQQTSPKDLNSAENKHLIGTDALLMAIMGLSPQGTPGTGEIISYSKVTTVEPSPSACRDFMRRDLSGLERWLSS